MEQGLQFIVEENAPVFVPNRPLGYISNVFGDFNGQKCVDFRYDIRFPHKVEHFFHGRLKKYTLFENYKCRIVEKILCNL